MRVIPLSDIPSMQEGEAVPSVSATLHKVFDPREGNSKGRDWKFQDIILKDGNLTVKGTLNNCDTLPSREEGRKVIINCHSGKHGLTGVKIKWDDYIPDDAPKGYEGQNILWITPTAEFAFEGVAQERQENRRSSGGGRQQEFSDQGSARRTRSNEPGGKDEPTKDDLIRSVKRTVAKCSSTLVLAYEGALYVSDTLKKIKGYELTADQVSHAAATLFIEACKNGAAKEMPVVNLATYDPEASKMADAEKQAKAESEKAEQEAREREEQERKEREQQAREEREKRAREAEDEDVPF